MRKPLLAALASAAVAVSACSSATPTKSGLSTAAILGDVPAAASGDRPGITKDDPMARPVQVAWTAARAQKCGFNFDASKLKAGYIAFEQRSGADAGRIGQLEKTYDMTVTKIRGTIESAETYCTEKQANLIKADLQRHLAGNYDPNFPEDKKVAQGNFFSKAADQTQHGRFDPKTAWRDIEDKKNGVRPSN